MADDTNTENVTAAIETVDLTVPQSVQAFWSMLGEAVTRTTEGGGTVLLDDLTHVEAGLASILGSEEQGREALQAMKVAFADQAALAATDGGNEPVFGPF